MRWQLGRRSENIEDRRGQGGGFRMGGGGLPIGGKGLGIGGVLIVVVISMFLGVDPSVILSGGGLSGPSGSQTQPSGPPPQISADEQKLADFVSVVLADTEDTWSAIFKEQGGQYRDPTLVLFSQEVRSACGMAESATGPFYCPGDQKLYLDLAFFNELSQRFGAPGEFARAYVVAHEVGHHVQTLLGISDQVRQAQAQSDEAGANRLSVALELQADCFAGVWANRANQQRQILEAGDREAGLRAAAAVGDDTLQRAARGRVVPDSFTHGSAAQRQEWLTRGLDSGDMNVCNTFGTGGRS